MAIIDREESSNWGAGGRTIVQLLPLTIHEDPPFIMQRT
jgi:hypothetical protein